jgi:hypothetical protein
MSGGPQPLPPIPFPAWLGVPLGGGAAGGVAKEGPSDKSGTTGADDPAKKLQAIKDLLNKSTTGAAAVKFFEDKKLKAEFVAGGGSFWDGSKMVIDGNHTTERAALAIVHEVNHAKATLDGTTPDIMKETRGEYVRKMLEEEARGTIDSIRTKNELVAGGTSITATYPLESEYNAAYKKASEDLAKSDPASTAAQRHAAGEQAGQDRVMKGFKDGEVVGSKSKIPYPEIYGKAWDKNHPTK